MGLKIIKNADGTFRPTWYGRISVRGRKRETNLNVPLAGDVPTDAAGNVALSRKRDNAFERSRKAAQKAFEAWRKESPVCELVGGVTRQGADARLVRNGQGLV